MKYYIAAFIIFLLIAFGLFKFANNIVQESTPTLPSAEIAANELKNEVKEDTLTIDTTGYVKKEFPPDSYFDTLTYKTANGYKEINWKTLSYVHFEEKYVDTIAAYVPFPDFHYSIRALDGQKVQIEGYIIPIEETGDASIIVLSAYPFSNCFFCGNAGPETIMDIKLAQNQGKRMKQDDRRKFRGTLRLNDSDLYYLNYILENAEIVR